MKSDFAQSATLSRFSASAGNPPLNKGSNSTGTGINQSGAGGVKDQDPSHGKQPNVLPGYRESIYGNIHQQTLAWRDNTRPDASAAAQFPRVTAMEERRPGYFATSPVEPLSQLNVRSQVDHRTSQSFSPPLLNSESTSGTTISSGSNSSSLQYMPRTPLEPSVDRPLAIPPPYPSKSYENQLPPFRALSLSPQTSINLPYNSPPGKAKLVLWLISPYSADTIESDVAHITNSICRRPYNGLPFRGLPSRVHSLSPRGNKISKRIRSSH